MRRARLLGWGIAVAVGAVLTWALLRGGEGAPGSVGIDRERADVPPEPVREVPRLEGDASRAPAPAPPAPTASSGGKALERGRVTIAGRLVERTTGLAISRVALAIHVQDARGKTTLLAAETARDGTFEVVGQVEALATVTGVEFAAPGLRDGDWFPEGRAVGAPVTARVGETLRLVIRADETFDLRGTVVDERGAPLEDVSVRYVLPPSGPSSRASTEEFQHTGRAGRFVVERLPVHPAAAGDEASVRRAALLALEKDGFAPARLDPWSVPSGNRDSVRVVMGRGRTVSGRLLDERGRPVAGVEVEADYREDPDARRTALTDADGRFRIDLLIDGSARLGALVLASDAEARRDVTIASDLDGVELVARPIDLSDARRPVNVAGMRLVPIDDELRRRHGLFEGVRVVVLDPGANVARWGVGRLEAGYGILMVGDVMVMSVREVVERMLEPPEQGPGVHIVYAFPNNAGTNTQYLRLTEEDRASLRRTLEAMR